MLLFCRSCCRGSGTGAGLLCCFSAAGDPSRLPAAAGRACLFACLVASSVGSCRRPFVCFQASRLPAFSAASLLPGILPSFQLPPGLCCRGRASFSAAGMLPGFQLPPIRSRRRIYFYKFNLFLCCRGIFFFGIW